MQERNLEPALPNQSLVAVRWLLYSTTLYLAAVAETSLAESLRIGEVGPDFLALAAMLWLLVIARPGQFLAAGGCGLVQDLMAPGRVGPGAAGFLLAGYLVSRIRLRLAPEHFLWHVALTWAGTTVLAISSAAWAWLAGETLQPWLILSQRAAGVGLYTAAGSVPLLLIAGWTREQRVQSSGFRVQENAGQARPPCA